jgi:hypothetical protein
MTDALAEVAIGRDSASRGGEQPLKSRVCRYFSTTGSSFISLIIFLFAGERLAMHTMNMQTGVLCSMLCQSRDLAQLERGNSTLLISNCQEDDRWWLLS